MGNLYWISALNYHMVYQLEIIGSISVGVCMYVCMYINVYTYQYITVGKGDIAENLLNLHFGSMFVY